MASNGARRTFCNSVNDLPMSVRLHRALSRDLKIKLVSLVAPLRRRTQSVGENLDLLLAAHFPNWVVTEVVEAPAAAPDVWTGRWMGGLSLIGEWNGQFILLPHTEVQEWMGYSWPCRKRNRGLLSLTWSRSCMPAWQLARFQPHGTRLK